MGEYDTVAAMPREFNSKPNKKRYAFFERSGECSDNKPWRIVCGDQIVKDCMTKEEA